MSFGHLNIKMFTRELPLKSFRSYSYCKCPLNIVLLRFQLIREEILSDEGTKYFIIDGNRNTIEIGFTPEKDVKYIKVSLFSPLFVGWLVSQGTRIELSQTSTEVGQNFSFPHSGCAWI